MVARNIASLGHVAGVSAATRLSKAMGAVLLGGVAAAALLAAASPATAQCVVGATTVTCADTTTKDTTFPANAATKNDRHYTFGVTAVGIVSAGKTVDGAGLAIESTGGVTVVNNGTILANTVPSAGGGAALSVSGAGTISVTTGNVDNIITGAAVEVLQSGAVGTTHVIVGKGTVSTQTGQAIIVDSQASSGQTTISVFGTVEGPNGIRVTADTGRVVVNGDGTGVVTATSGHAIMAQTASGDIVAAGIGPVVASGGVGIAGISNSGNVTIATSGTVASDQFGIAAISGDGNIRITTGAAVNSQGAAIHAASNNNGSVAIGLGGDVTGNIYAVSNGADVTVGGTGNVTSAGGLAAIAGGGAGDVRIAVNGKVNSSSIGILAASYTGDVTVRVSGATIAQQEGVYAYADAGKVGVAVLGNVTSGTAAGIRTSVLGAGGSNISVGDGKVVVGKTAGLQSEALGDGSVAITTGALSTVHATAGRGIATSAEDGDTSIVIGGRVTGATGGIASTAVGGNIAVTVLDGGNVFGAKGVQASTTGAGSVSIANAGRISGVAGGPAIEGAMAGGAFHIANRATGVITGKIDVTGAAATSIFDNRGVWSTGTGVSTYSGTLVNHSTVVVQGQTTIGDRIINVGGARIGLQSSGSLTVGGQLHNSGVITVAGGATLTATAGGIVNANAGSIHVAVGGTVNDDLSNSATVVNNGTYNGKVAVNTGTIINNGTWNGDVALSSGHLANTMTWNGSIVSTGALDNWSKVNGNVTNDGLAINRGTITGNVVNNGAGEFMNFNGAAVSGSTRVNGGTATNFGTLQDVVIGPNGEFINKTKATAGAIINAGSATNAGTVASLTNNADGDFANLSGAVITGQTTVNGGFVTNSGTMHGVEVGPRGELENLFKATTGDIVNNGLVYNNGTVAIVSNAASGTFDNDVSGVTGAFTNAGMADNSGTIASLTNTGRGDFHNHAGGKVLGLTTIDGGVVSNDGKLQAVVIGAAGTLENEATGKAGAITSSGRVTNSGAVDTVTNNAGAVFTNERTGTTAAFQNAGSVVNRGEVASLGNTGGTFTNNGRIAGDAEVTGGRLITTGVIEGKLTNSAAVAAQGSIVGAVVNQGAGSMTVTGGLVTGGGVVNSGSAVIAVSGGNLTIAAGLDNDSVITIAAGRALSAQVIDNGGLGRIEVGAGAVLRGTGNTLNNAGAINVAANGAIVDAGSINNLATGVIAFNGAGSTGLLSAGAGKGAIDNQGRIGLAAGARAAIAGDLTNSGTVDMQNAATTNTVLVTGNYAGTGAAKLKVDADTSSGASDRLAIAGTASGVTVVDINVVQKGVKSATIASAAGDGQFVFGGGNGLDPFAAGLVQYRLERQGDNWVLQPSINGAALSGLTNLASSISTITTSFHQPASNFVNANPNARPGQIQYGIWARGDAARYTVHNTTRLELDGNAFQAPTDSRLKIGYEAIQSGLDVAMLKINGSAWDAHVGVTGGHVTGRVRSTGVATELDAPFVSGYLFVTNGQFTFDLTARHEWHNAEFSSPVFGDALGHKVDGSANAVSAVASYRFNHGRWFVTPTVGLSYTRTQLDPFKASAGLSTIDAGSDEALIGRAGLQVSHAIPISSSAFFIPFASAAASRNFTHITDATITITDTGGIATVFDTATVGVRDSMTYTGGFAVADPKLGVSGFVQGSIREGDRISGGSVSIGGRINF